MVLRRGLDLNVKKKQANRKNLLVQDLQGYQDLQGTKICKGTLRSDRRPVGEHLVSALSLTVPLARDTSQRTMASRRRYVPWREKHKAPQGFGSPCPPMPSDGAAQQLLDGAVGDPSSPDSNKLYAVLGDWCFVAQLTRTVGDEAEYHGYPEIGKNIPTKVLRKLEQEGRITNQQKKRLRTQAALPDTPPQIDPKEN